MKCDLCCLCERGNQIALVGRNAVQENPIVIGKHFVKKNALPEDPSSSVDW